MTRRELLINLARAGVAAPIAVGTAAVAGQAPRKPGAISVLGPDTVPVSKAVLKPEDLKFRGFVRLPPANVVGDLWFSSGGLAMRRVGGELRLFTLGNQPDDNPVFELRLPDAAPNVELASAPVASLARGWGAIMKGRMLTGGSGGALVGGLRWDADRNALWWTYGDVYVPVQSHPTIGCTVLNDGAGTFASFGPWRTEWNSQRTRGSFCQIPAAFAASYTSGSDVGLMSGMSAGNLYSPYGACLSAIRLPDPVSTPANLTTNTDWTVANQGVILHDIDHRQARDTRYKYCGWKVKYDCAGGADLKPGIPLFGGPDTGSNSDDTMHSCVWIDLPEKHGLLYFGQLATTPEGYTAPGDADGYVHQWYGAAYHGTSSSGIMQACCHNQDDPFWISTGPGTHYRVGTGWIYNPNDLVATAQKKANLWSRTPTSVFEWRKYVPQLNPRYAAGMFPGAYFDAPSRRLYVMLSRHDRLTVPPHLRPVLMVFDVT